MDVGGSVPLLPSPPPPLQVSDLKAELSLVKAHQDKLQAEVSAATAARDAAQERANTFKSEVEQLQFMLDEVHSKRSDSPPSKVIIQCAQLS